MNKVLLVEPAYKNKYPPLGLMKLSTYHKLRGDYVHFVKGCDREARKEHWDRIYVSTLFTFHWKKTVDTIAYYMPSSKEVVVGGVMATLMGNELEREFSVKVVRGLLDKPGLLDSGDHRIIDTLTPDYSMLGLTDYKYGLDDAYIGYATRGCPNKCGFCAVRRIEPSFCDYLPLKRQVKNIEEVYGPKQHLVLLDNNVLASSEFERIIGDIIELGFEKGAKRNNRRRYVDFNQGLDLRLLTPDKMKLLSKIALKPMRLAFDHISLKDQYVDKVKMAVDHGITHLSNYVLYNYTDTPEDFYERLRINVELNQELGTQIYSFPMKYVPLDAKDRSYVGKHWTKRLLRGVQCVLNSTRGIVGASVPYFAHAFGNTAEEFMALISRDEEDIMHRARCAEEVRA